MPPLPPLVRIGEGVLSSSTVSRRVASGELAPVLPGVYLRADVADNLQWRAAAVAAWRPEAVLLEEMAAALTFWPELAVSSLAFACKTTVRRPGLRFTRREIPSEWLRHRGQLRLTHPALTALDLAATRGGEAIDRVLRSRQARIEDLYAALTVSGHRRGNPERRRLLLESRAEPWSAAERIAHAILRQSGIRGWRANAPIHLDGQDYFLDIAFERIRLAVEIDGYEVHCRRDVFESDRRRQNSLQEHGWTVLRFTYRMLTEDPSYVARTTERGLIVAERRALRV